MKPQIARVIPRVGAGQQQEERRGRAILSLREEHRQSRDATSQNGEVVCEPQPLNSSRLKNYYTAPNSRRCRRGTSVVRRVLPIGPSAGGKASRATASGRPDKSNGTMISAAAASSTSTIVIAGIPPSRMLSGGVINMAPPNPVMPRKIPASTTTDITRAVRLPPSIIERRALGEEGLPLRLRGQASCPRPDK